MPAVVASVALRPPVLGSRPTDHERWFPMLLHAAAFPLSCQPCRRLLAQGVLPPRPSALHHAASNLAGQRPGIGNGAGPAAVSTQCSLLSLGSSGRRQGGSAGGAGNQPEPVSCCSARSAGSTGHVFSSSKAGPGDSPSCSCPSASSTAVSSGVRHKTPTLQRSHVVRLLGCCG